MKQYYSTQIKNVSQEVDKFKREIELIEMQINSLLNQSLNRSANFPRHETEAHQKANPRFSGARSTESSLPHLRKKPLDCINKPNQQPFSAHESERSEFRYRVNEPLINLNQFSKSPRKINNNSDSNTDSSSSGDKFSHLSNSIEIKNNNNNEISNNNNEINNNEINNNNNEKEINNNNNNINYYVPKPPNNRLKQTEEMKKTDDKIQLQAEIDEMEEYMKEIDEIISDNFEDQKNSDDD